MMRCYIAALSLLVCLYAADSVPAQSGTPLDGSRTSIDLPLSQWAQTEGSIFPFSPIDASYSIPNNEWSFSTNNVQPRNCFGWIEGPRVLVPAPGNDVPGHFAGVRVHIEYPADFTGLAPEMRVRLNSVDFGVYATGGIATAQYRNLGGSADIVAVLDRRQLTQATEFRVYLDMYSAYEATSVVVDPNWTIRVTAAEYFATTPDGPYAPGDLINAAYVSDQNRVLAFVGDANVEQNVRNATSTDVAFAFQGPYIAVLESGALYGYTTFDEFVPHIIAASNVLSAGVFNEHIVYVEADQQVWYYNMLTEESRLLGDRHDFQEAISSGEGTIIVTANNGQYVDLYRFDTRQENPQLEMLRGSRPLTAIYGRSTSVIRR